MTGTAVERLEFIANIQPCQVVLPGGRTVLRARVLLYQGHVFVAEHDRMREQPSFVAAFPVLEPVTLPPTHIPRRHQQAHIETNAGTLHVQMLPGCRCGSLLRNLPSAEIVQWAVDAGYPL